VAFSSPGGDNKYHIFRYENIAPGGLFARWARWAPRQVCQVASPGERQVASKWPEKGEKIQYGKTTEKHVEYFQAGYASNSK